MDRQEVQTGLKEIVLDVLENEDIKDIGEEDDFVEDLDMDSLQAVSMLLHIERRFKITLPQTVLDSRFKNLRAVVDLVMASA